MSPLPLAGAAAIMPSTTVAASSRVIATLGKKMAGMRQLWSVARLSWLGRVEIGFVDLEHRLDLDGEIIGEVGASDDEAGMSAALAEDGDEKV